MIINPFIPGLRPPFFRGLLFTFRKGRIFPTIISHQSLTIQEKSQVLMLAWRSHFYHVLPRRKTSTEEAKLGLKSPLYHLTSKQNKQTFIPHPRNLHTVTTSVTTRTTNRHSRRVRSRKALTSAPKRPRLSIFLMLSGRAFHNRHAETALRTIVFGTAVAPPRGEWLRTGIVFREPDKELAYGLKAPRNGTRGLLSALQAEIIKILLFEKRVENANSIELFLKPDGARQLEVLVKAMGEILWRIGEKSKVIMCLPQDLILVPHSVNFFQDSLTEKLHLFEITSLEDLQIFIKRYIHVELADDVDAPE
ncbi:DUF4205 [Homalodisca vitripennis]|nr:DUF4205 [Homalodisca vitripennis]